ncbi:hypothetical protein Asppvi_010638 [Aspergillus pseudoviridinutans]|uniref:Uncharacterized protein n=1 Tax=Aspergillus pseudoviridinutans TaxID=1517512 RepID=A0A9P3BI42_9EURO|nr:uncharacterized protein Asppvi_010638 [Aspergillus pseudoviridinutans]GIJ91666.1 hypothetical protein Asppvi_010638 [Aspergillus pseudoviridinutans]
MAVEILDFPVEILEMIFFEAIRPWEDDIDDIMDYETGLCIALTCKRFNLVVRHVLYRRIELGTPDLDPVSKPAEGLLQTLSLYPDLQPTCQSFQIYLGQEAFQQKTFKTISKLVSLLHRVRVFEVSWSNGGHPLAWLLLLKAIQMNTLEEIRADDYFVPSEEALEIRRRDVWAVSMAALGDNIPGNVADFLDTQSENGTRPVIKTVKFNDFSQSPRLLQEILTWFTGLEHFAFTFNRTYDGNYTWNYVNLGAALDRHKETLKSILIRQCDLDWVGLFDLTSYTNLRVLELTFHDTVVPSPEAAATRLLAPNLKLLVFDFWTVVREKAKYNLIEKRDEEWLVQFGEHASKVRKSLPRVHAKIAAYAFQGTERELWDSRCTFEDLDNIQDQLQGYGIDFTFDDPPVSKEEFQEWIRDKDEMDLLGGLWRYMNRYAAYHSDKSDSGFESDTLDTGEHDEVAQESTDKSDTEEAEEETPNLITLSSINVSNLDELALFSFLCHDIIEICCPLHETRRKMSNLAIGNV